jgi:hypothetical protein
MPTWHGIEVKSVALQDLTKQVFRVVGMVIDKEWLETDLQTIPFEFTQLEHLEKLVLQG